MKGKSIRFYNDETMVSTITLLQNPLIILITVAKMILIGTDFVSAYAGIHYFAGRKQNASPNKADTVLTCPKETLD
jgi:hypothetical protein